MLGCLMFEPESLFPANCLRRLILIDVGLALPIRGCEAKAKNKKTFRPAGDELIALFVRAGMRWSPGDIFGLPENLFCDFPPRRREVHFYHVLAVIEHADDLTFFSANSVEDNLANRERLDWHSFVLLQPGAGLAEENKLAGSDLENL
jgi:hypothetical protein